MPLIVALNFLLAFLSPAPLPQEAELVRLERRVAAFERRVQAVRVPLVASWYGEEFHGRLTASGERFDQNALTCAHRWLPFGTRLSVLYRGREVVVTVNDRGPFVAGRDLDLSRGAARALGLEGVQKVEVAYYDGTREGDRDGKQSKAHKGE